MFCVFSVISYMSLKLLESFTPVTPGLSTVAGSLTVASQMLMKEGMRDPTGVYWESHLPLTVFLTVDL